MNSRAKLIDINPHNAALNFVDVALLQTKAV
jgi:hypothetical protein